MIVNGENGLKKALRKQELSANGNKTESWLLVFKTMSRKKKRNQRWRMIVRLLMER